MEKQPSKVCPDCGSDNYWHKWTDEHKVVETACCGVRYRVLPNDQLEKIEEVVDKSQKV